MSYRRISQSRSGGPIHPISVAMRWGRLLAALALAFAATGCSHLAEDVVTELVKHDLKAIDQDFGVFEGDLALFKKCLDQRGGSCPSGPTQPLPGSSHHLSSQPVAPVNPAGSHVLATSVAALPAGHPAKIAHRAISHPVVQQAAAVHNHLRGLDAGSTTGVSVTRGQGDHGGPQSTVTMDLDLKQTTDLHTQLLTSIGSRSWDALHQHCQTLLTEHQGNPDVELAAGCRRAAFVRGYLGAYLHHGDFVTVDVELAGAVRAIQNTGQKIEADIQPLRDRLAQLEADVSKVETRAVTDLAADAKDVSSAVVKLIDQVRAAITRRFPHLGSEITGDLTRLASHLESGADGLVTQAEQGATKEVSQLATELDKDLAKVDAKLKKLQDEVRGYDTQVVDQIDTELSQVDRKLSNVFKISPTGFVSRDLTFAASLPTFKITLDPTAKHLVTAVDQETGKTVTADTNFSQLGVVTTETSGVGTGAAIGAELVRVFLEALFDAHEGLPGLAPANPGAPGATGLTLGAYSLPVFQSPTGHVDSSDLSHIDAINTGIALKTRLIVGRAISGLGPFSLNNRSLEDLITEIVTTVVRKAAEKASWCWYACNLDVELDKLRADLEKTAEDTLSQLEKKAKAAVDAEVAKLEGELAKAEKKIQQAVAAGEAKVKADLEAERSKLQAKIAAEKAKLSADLEDAGSQAWAQATSDAEHVKLRLKVSQ